MQPFKEFTRQQIKKKAGLKSNNALNIAMKQFMKDKLLSEKKVGRSSLYSLDFKNDIVYYYMALSNHTRLGKLAHRTTEFVKEDINRVTPFYSLVVFGSYAVGEESAKSDIDVAVFIEDGKKKAERALKNAELHSVLKLDAHVITRDEMIEMLTNGEWNLGKEIASKHLAVHNHQLFYSLLFEAMKNGFKIVYEKGRE